MKSLAVAAAAALLGLAAAGSFAADVARESRAVSGFSRIEIDGQADVMLRQGSTEGVTIEAPARSLKQIRTEVRDRTLKIDLADQGGHWWQWIFGAAPRTPRITIDFIQVEHLEAAGAITLVADRMKAKDLRLDFAGACKLRIADLQATTLRLDASGAVKADIAGDVTEQHIDLSGAGSYQAGDLVSDTVLLQVSGAGKAIVNAKTLLRAGISGAGLVEYIGNPKVERDISGIGKIRRR
ncbi:MAG: head GIN domain-containing protein [Casimicrobiaceae bacterium]